MGEEAYIETELSRRKEGSMGAREVSPSRASVLIHGVHTDGGVARNGGRRGARFGCEAILSAFKRLSPPSGSDVSWAQLSAAPSSFDELDFALAQEKESHRLVDNFAPDKINIHLGGGHDHIYPLLTALDSFKKPIHVVNIDAHLDTRTDAWAHSGTPFRQFAHTRSVPFRLSQMGIHPTSNPESSYRELPDCEMNILEINKAQEYLCISPEEMTVLSLDCDALCSSFLSGVSAVNPAGLTRGQLESVAQIYGAGDLGHPPILGVYEYNPIYDDLSGRGAKFLAFFLYKMIFRVLQYSH